MLTLNFILVCLLFSSKDVYEPYPPLSTSAPPGKEPDAVDNDKVSIGGSETDGEDDEFTRLKRIREEERLSR